MLPELKTLAIITVLAVVALCRHAFRYFHALIFVSKATTSSSQQLWFLFRFWFGALLDFRLALCICRATFHATRLNGRLTSALTASRTLTSSTTTSSFHGAASSSACTTWMKVGALLASPCCLETSWGWYAGPRNAPVILCCHGEPSWCFLYRKMIPPLVAGACTLQHACMHAYIHLWQHACPPTLMLVPDSGLSGGVP